MGYKLRVSQVVKGYKLKYRLQYKLKSMSEVSCNINWDFCWGLSRDINV